MTSDLFLLAVAGLAYLGLLFGIADLTERGLVPQRIVRHPLTFSLSLGVYATSWTLYGSVGFADRQGYDFLAIYFGPTLACLLIPVVWLPLLRLTRNLQLSSLADLVAFRYQSQAAGVLVTLFMVLGSLPYLALQIRAVAEAAAFFAPGAPRALVGLVFSLTVLGFAVLFGTRHHRLRQPRPGLVVAIAFESVVKLVALLLVAGVAYFGVLGGPSGVAQRLAATPAALVELHAPVREAPWVTLLALSGSAAFLLPRQFHMAFAERPSERSLLHATWLFPLLLLLLNVGIVPILWAGREVAPGLPPDLYVLAVARTAPAVATLAFLGGVSASSAMVIVSSLALAGMMLNHLVVPAWHPRGDVYGRLTVIRRGLVAAMIFAGWAAYVALEPTGGLVQLGLVSFVAVAQLVPAMIGVLFWRRATRLGLLVGLSLGIFGWFALLILPGLGVPFAFDALIELFVHIDPSWTDRWVATTATTLLLNGGGFALVSLFTRGRAEEREAAATCARDLFSTAPFGRFTSVEDIEARVAKSLGAPAARAEIEQARRELDVEPSEVRPAVLHQLAEQVERNLSGLVGPLPARSVLRDAPEVERARSMLAEQLRFVETQIEELRLDGTASQIDLARRYLRGVLEDLPMGICGVDADAQIILWNQRMQQITGLTVEQVVEHGLGTLPEPWSAVLMDALLEVPGASDEREVWDGDRRVIVRVDRTDLSSEGDTEGAVLVLEDRTERRALESQVAHQGRLASIGRLAAGIAHEVGNPLTGIVMVASNLRRESVSEDVEERLGLLIDEARRIQDIVQNLVDFSRGGSGSDPMGIEPRPVDVREVAQEAVKLLRLGRRHREVDVRVEAPAGIVALADKQRLVQVFLNLLANACDASRPGQVVRVQAEPSGTSEVRIDVIDEGHGIEPAAVSHLFDPFYTTKPVGEGTGLGLAVVFSIVRAHGGRIDVQSEPGRGTRMQAFLPAAVEEAAS